MSILRAAVGIVTLPATMVLDVLTLPSIAYNDREFNTARQVRNIVRNIQNATTAD